MNDEPTIRIRDGSLVTREEYDMMEPQAQKAKANRQVKSDSSLDYSDLVARLRAELAEMASTASVDMELWSRFSNRVLDAANALEAQARRIAELSEAIGLLTTLKPDMEIDANNPINMSTQIVAHVDACIAELTAALKPFKKYADLCDEASMTGLWSVPGEDLRAARAAYLGEKE